MQNDKNNQNEKGKKINKKLLSIIAVAVLAVVIVVISLLLGRKDEPETPPSSSSQVSQPESVATISSSAPEVESIIEEEEIDLSELQEINSDTIGYIEVPGTAIDHPVVRGIDNAKYLTTDFYGDYDVMGTVFADMFNSDSLQDPVTVLYGHYEPGGTFFSKLHQYSDPEYFSANPDVFLTTPTAEYRYEVVAAFVNDNYNILYEKDFSDPVQLQGFIDKMANAANANLNLDDVSTDDTFLALSTCMSLENTAERYVVVARLVE